MSLPIERRLDQRHRGFRGGFIPMHRALHHLDVDAPRVAASVLLVVAFVTGWAFAWPFVARLWAATGGVLLEVLGIEASTAIVSRELVAGVLLDVPRFVTAAGLPSPTQWFVGLGVAAFLLIFPVFLGDRWRPLAYAMRLLAAVQISSQLVFALFPTAFPYDVGGMTEVSMLANLFVIGLVPLVMGIAYFPLAHGFAQRVAAVTLPMLHLTIAVPLLYVGHAWILHHGSLLWMPLLFWAFGLPLSVFSIVALYGWASSWPRQERAPRRRAPRPRPTWAAGLVLLVFAPSAASADDVVRSVQVGLDRGEYTEDLGSLNGALVAYTQERPWKDRWRFDVGYASRFGDEGVGIGASYGRHLGRSRVLSAGLSTGTGDVILPAWRFDIGLRQTGLLDDRLLVDVGYTHFDTKEENSTDSVSGGLLLAVGGGFQVGLDGRLERGQPGDTTGHSIAGSLLYGIYRSFYANVRYEVGRVAYLLVGPSDALVEFDSRGLRAGVTWYIERDRGVGLEFNRLDTDAYDFTGVGVRAFREW